MLVCETLVHFFLIWPTATAAKVVTETKIYDAEPCNDNACFPFATRASSGDEVLSARASPTELANAQSGASVDALRDIRRVTGSVVSYAEETDKRGAHRNSGGSVDAAVSLPADSQESEDLGKPRRGAKELLSGNAQIGELSLHSAVQLDAERPREKV